MAIIQILSGSQDSQTQDKRDSDMQNLSESGRKIMDTFCPRLLESVKKVDWQTLAWQLQYGSPSKLSTIIKLSPQ